MQHVPTVLLVWTIVFWVVVTAWCKGPGPFTKYMSVMNEVFICFHAVHVPINPHYISINPYKSPSPSPSIRPQRSADRVQQRLLLPRESVVDTGAKPVGPGAFPMRAACMPGVFAVRSQIGWFSGSHSGPAELPGQISDGAKTVKCFNLEDKCQCRSSNNRTGWWFQVPIETSVDYDYHPGYDERKQILETGWYWFLVLIGVDWYWLIWAFPEMGGVPKLSILMGFPLNYTPSSYWGIPISVNPPYGFTAKNWEKVDWERVLWLRLLFLSGFV